MEETIKYFQSHAGYFWQWETDQDAFEFPGDEYNQLSIPHVSVIAYRTHTLELLKVMAEGGIPPFGAFLLVLYATGNFRFSNFDGLNYYLTKTEKVYGGLIDKRAVINFLNSVSKLPLKLKTGENKVLLLQTVFNNCHNQLAAAKAKQVMEGIKVPGAVQLCAVQKPFHQAFYIRDLKTLELLNEKFPDATSIIQAMQGLPPIPDPIDEVAEPQPAAAEKSFVDMLIDEPKTFEVGNLIRHIWSGLKIPMQHFSPGDQPLGGISDMTNKGNIDHMLLSEFAYDDDIFLQRVANNEALYIQREIPPEKNIFERVIIVDISLRNWGTPKTMAFATALAIARHPKAKDECRIFLAAQTAREIQHGTVQDIMGALALVAPVPDCSAGLQDFFGKEGPTKKREIFLLTAEDSFMLPSVQKTISDHREHFKFVVCFSANGTIQFLKMQQGAKRLLQTIVLPLDELWKKRRAKQEKAVPEKERTYPILFTAFPNHLGGFYLDGVYYFLSRKKILYKTYMANKGQSQPAYYQNFRGWEPVIKNISLKPQGSFALGKNGENELLLCQYNNNDKILSVLNLQTKKYWSLKCKERKAHTLLFFKNNFYISDPGGTGYLKIIIGEEALGLSNAAETEALQSVFNMQELQVRQAIGYSKDILSNHTSVGITEDGHLHFSKHTLVVEHSCLFLANRRPAGFAAVAVRQGNSFCFDDGSTVLVDAEGMITLCSSNQNLPDVFIPSCVGTTIAAATAESYCGVEYYLPQNHHFTIEKVDFFYEKYIKTFIHHIIAHAATA